MKRYFEAYRDPRLVRRLLARARCREARVRSVNLYALLVVVSVVAALVAVAQRLGSLGGGETP